MENLLTIKEASRITGYRESYIRKLLSLGKIKKTKLQTGGVRIKVEDLKSWIGEVE